MSLLEDLQHALASEASDFDTPPEHITVVPDDEGAKYVATGSWWVEPDNGPETDEDDLLTPTMPRQSKCDLTLSGDLESRVSRQYDQFHDRVHAPNATMNTPKLVQATVDPESERPNEIHPQFDASLAFMCYLTADHNRAPPTGVRESIAEMYADIDSDIDAESITVRRFGFSDRYEARLVNADIEICTPHPQRYCDGVDSLDTLLAQIDIDNHSFFSRDGDQYRLSYLRLFRSDGDLPEHVIESAESQIAELADATVETRGEFAVESQFLSYVDGDYGFYLHLPITRN